MSQTGEKQHCHNAGISRDRRHSREIHRVKSMKSGITEQDLKEAGAAFEVGGSIRSCERYGNGHINDTFRLSGDKDYILQRINTEIFRSPEDLMKNIEEVTAFLRKKIVRCGGDPERETLNLVPARDGKSWYRDSRGNYWRVYRFITHASCYEQVRDSKMFYQCGLAFGNFQQRLSDYPADTLSETIPRFHDTPGRFADFQKAVAEDLCGRVKTARPEIDFVMEREADCGIIARLQAGGELPLRVTHNDTKLNNIMMDDETGKAICIIDLDTVMQGMSVFDFGDAIRFGANTAAEDETDLTKVSLSLPLYEAFTEGFQAGCGGTLTQTERDMLPQGARIMTLECGMRFLTDYLQGDRYFRIARERHNLDRCRTQFRLVGDMEKKWDEMQKIVRG